MIDGRGRMRAIFAIGASLLAFAGEGLQGLVAATIGQNSMGAQAGVIGVAFLSYLFLELFNSRDQPVRRPRTRKTTAAKKRTTTTRKAPQKKTQARRR